MSLLNTDSHFANYRFSFRKLQILISQTTDFHFANYRFSFRFIPFHFVSFRFSSFRFANYSKPAKSLKDMKSSCLSICTSGIKDNEG